MSINMYQIVESRSNIVMFADVDEQMQNGDVIVISRCRFYTADGEDIGYARVIEDGQHRHVNGDYHGRRLLEKFQYIGA